MDKITIALDKHYKAILEKDGYVIADKLRDTYLGKEIRENTVLSLYDIKVEQKRSLVGKTIRDTTLSKYLATRKRIADVEMTGMWEDTFTKIEAGTTEAINFKKGIEVYAGQITEELLNTKLSLPEQETMPCPKCGKDVKYYPKVAKCSNPDCGLMLFTSLSGNKLSIDVIRTLLSGKQTPTVKGFKSKTGKYFDAALVLDEEYKIKFIFDNKPNKKGRFPKK